MTPELLELNLLPWVDAGGLRALRAAARCFAAPAERAVRDPQRTQSVLLAFSSDRAWVLAEDRAKVLCSVQLPTACSASFGVATVIPGGQGTVLLTGKRGDQRGTPPCVLRLWRYAGTFCVGMHAGMLGQREVQRAPEPARPWGWAAGPAGRLPHLRAAVRAAWGNARAVAEPPAGEPPRVGAEAVPAAPRGGEDPGEGEREVPPGDPARRDAPTRADPGVPAPHAPPERDLEHGDAEMADSDEDVFFHDEWAWPAAFAVQADDAVSSSEEDLASQADVQEFDEPPEELLLPGELLPQLPELPRASALVVAGQFTCSDEVLLLSPEGQLTAVRAAVPAAAPRAEQRRATV